MNVLERFLEFFAPHECLACTTEGYLLCAGCAAMLPSIQPRTDLPGTIVYGVTRYEGIAKALVHRLKFERAARAADDMAVAMVAVLPPHSYDGVTYVPTAPSRVRQRGYDQAALLARRVATLADLPCYGLLARSGMQRQVGASRKQRHMQQQGNFRMMREPAASRLLLVDDVITTGSTIRAAADTLRAAGAHKVDGLVFASA